VSVALPLSLIAQARHRLRGRVHRTPAIQSAALTARFGVPVWVKLEFLQKTGSFKTRGAFNKMLTLTTAERACGVVAVSGGNHAQAVAYVGRELGIGTTICMPETTPRNYLEATRGYGANVVLTPDIRTAFAEADRLKDAGKVMVHPFDDPLLAAGQGTIGLEILDDVPQATHVYVSIGGGGLIAGIASALKTIKPDVRVVGVETHGADAMAQALAAGRLVELPAITSIARTLGAPRVSEFTFAAVRELVAEVEVVSDAETVRELIFVLERMKYLVEPAAACVLAAAERHRGRFTPGDTVVLLLCGGNVAVEDLCGWRQRFGG
jgi:threonine dehydratase